ncbi:MAG: phosphate ABC transporter permease subunit PstC, partial [Sphingomonas sp.]
MVTPAIALLAVLALAAVAWFAARAKAMRFAPATSAAQRPHSRPAQHGWYVALWALLPALMFLAVWSVVAPGLVTTATLDTPAAAAVPDAGMARAAILAEVRGLASGRLTAAFNPQAPALLPAYQAAQSRFALIGFTLAVILAFTGGAFAWSRLSPQFRARTRVERMVMAMLLAASLIAIVTTVGIVASLLFESLRFFAKVSPLQFLFGTLWSPQTGDQGTFGAVPLFWGTIFIGAIIAMAVAIPLGLLSAIYLTQYAAPRTRRWLKPILEVLAGVPTVVYGYFAALTIAPAIRDFAAFLHIPGASSESALAAGLVMGVMIIPFVSSMADDSLAAVPQSMRDGSLAMGATTSETIRRVLVPAALPGVVGGVLLAVSRAIGETMIVVMAAGLAANLTANPFASVTTVTTQI